MSRTLFIECLEARLALAPLTVAALTPANSGFAVEFSSQLDVSELNLYDSTLGAADVELTGAASGPVSGSLVVDPSLGRTMTFLKTGGPLAADTYMVRLRSADNGIMSMEGEHLDGDGDGTSGDDFIGSFTIAPDPPMAVTVASVDFVRGPGQNVNIPADSTSGIPLTISVSEELSVRSVSLRMRYEPSLLEITSVTVGAEMPERSALIFNNASSTGLVTLSLWSPAEDLPAGTNALVTLQARVPATGEGAHYAQGQMLDFHDASVRDDQDNEVPVMTDDAVHLAAYFADVTGNGRVDASDAVQVAQHAALLITGFPVSSTFDPALVGDISGNGKINAADASLVAQFAVELVVPQIPPIPSGIAIAGGSHRLPRLPNPAAATEELATHSLTAGGDAVSGALADRYLSPALEAAEEPLSVVLEELEDLESASAGAALVDQVLAGWD